MWVFLSGSFLSIVDSPEAGKNKLSVRSRFKGDIERVFPGVKVRTTARRDYRFRAFIPQERVAQALADEVLNMGYSNFKDSVLDNDRHNTYLRVWHVMANAQEAALKPKPKQRQQPLWGESNLGSFADQRSSRPFPGWSMPLDDDPIFDDDELPY